MASDTFASSWNSLASQSHLPAELQVGDDGSTDDTLAILEEFQERAPFPVHINVNSRRLGYGENFIQTALRCGSGWIAFCDQDDVWLPQKVERCVEIIASGPADLQLVVHDALVIDEAGAEIGPLRGWPDLQAFPRLSLPPIWFCSGLSQVFNRRLLIEFPSANRCMGWVDVPDAHDVWIPFLAGTTGTVIRIGEPLALYRRHRHNASPIPWEDGVTAVSAGDPFQVSRHVAAVAQALTALADRVPELRARALLSDAAGQNEELAERLRMWAEFNDSGSLARRLALLTKLIALGAYATGGYFTRGKRALLSDLGQAIKPRPGAPG